jgi:chorismate dehydratase
MNRPKIRLGAISFINTLPIYFPFGEPDSVELVYAEPTTLNQAMLNGDLDISPVSSAFYLRHPEQFVLLKDLSVSSPGSVESVVLFSRKPLGPELLDHPTIAVPDSSETSIALLAYLLKQKTGQDLRSWFHVYPAADYRHIMEETGCLLSIGDNALLMVHEGLPEGFQAYDLASLWVEETGFPFVFAVWIAQREWAERNPEQLEEINHHLIQARQSFFQDKTLLQEGVRIAKSRCTISAEEVQSYYTQSLTYDLSEKHLQALDLFGSILRDLDSTNRERETTYWTRSQISL